MHRFIASLLMTSLAACVWADSSFQDVIKQVNPKVVKIHGAGGYRGVTAYCTGVLVSADGYILTVYSPTLDTRDIRVYLYDGQQHECEMVSAEPQLDVALLRIKEGAKKFADLPLPHFDLKAKIPEAQVGQWILGFSNAFEVAQGDEPVSVQRGVISAITPLTARKGVADAPYKGNVFIVDAIVCNPGSHGGVLTTRKGELIGLIGKELRNNLTETWVNYAMPVKDLAYFVDKAKKGEYKQMEVKSTQDIVNKNAYHGLILVPKILDRTPPYVDEVDFDSPAGRAGVKPDDLIMFVRLPARDGTGAMEELQVNHTDALQDVLAPLDPGSKIELIVRRSQQLLRMEFTLEKSRGGPPAVAKPPMKLRELD